MWWLCAVKCECAVGNECNFKEKKKRPKIKLNSSRCFNKIHKQLQRSQMNEINGQKIFKNCFQFFSASSNSASKYIQNYQVSGLKLTNRLLFTSISCIFLPYWVPILMINCYWAPHPFFFFIFSIYPNKNYFNIRILFVSFLRMSYQTF